ncbi:oligosaccharide flippase family protein [Idiomarina aquatica]|nr:oligosaccharide flippase family protein [Idiomarina aquatica]
MSSTLIKSILIMVSGTAGAQALTIAFTPLVTRLYSPETIGELGAFVALLNVLLPLAALTLPAAIVLPRRDETAVRLMQLCLRATYALALTVFITLALFHSAIANILNFSSASGYLMLLPVAMLFAGVYQVLQQWLIRQGEFKRIARIAILQSFLVNGSKVGAGLFVPLALTLIVIQTLGQAFFVLLLSRYRPSLKLSEKARLNVGFKLLLRKFRQFPLFQMPQQALNAVSISLPVLLLSALFSPAVAGWYTLSRTIMSAPSVMLGRAVGDVYYPKLAKLQHSGKSLTATIIKGTLALLALGAVPFGIVVVWGPELFSIAFGKQWQTAGEMAQWLALWVWVMFANPPALKAVMVLHVQHWALVINMVTLTMRIGALVLGAEIYDSMLVAIAGYSLVSLLHNLLIISLAIITSRRRP